MPESLDPFYITTAIAYPNGEPHIGHAYEYVATDAVARFKRLDGFDVRYLTGTDEHGLKVAQTAAAAGIPTAQLARRNSDVFEALQRTLNISFDRFIRTTDPDHYEASKAIWRKMADNGDIYLDTYSGWYSVRDEAYYTDAETTVSPTAPAPPPRRGLRSTGPRSIPISSGSRRTRTSCWRTTRHIPSSSAPMCDATRWSASSPAGCATCPSHGPPSTGECRSPTTPNMSCTCGWTR